MERENSLLARVVEENTETPRVCQVLALHLAGVGGRIPYNIKDAVLAAAVSNKDALREKIETVNLLAGAVIDRELLRGNFLDLAAQIAKSEEPEGIENPKAFERRLENLHKALYAFDDSDEGVGFTE